MLVLVLLTSTIWFCIAYLSPCRPLPSQVGSNSEDDACYSIARNNLQCPSTMLDAGTGSLDCTCPNSAEAVLLHSERPGVPGG